MKKKSDNVAIRVLKHSEEQSLQEYEEALRNAALSSEVKRLIRSRLMPETKAHIPALKRLLKKGDRST